MTTYEAVGAKILTQRRPRTEVSGLTPRESATTRRQAQPDGPANLSDVLNSINAVVYDWDMFDDRIVWGANAAAVLSAFPERALASGAAFADLVAANSETSRFQAIKDSP